jgi:hypothetical protein
MVQALAAEVVQTFRARDVDAILLKGPSVAHWLGGDLVRASIDCDLLVHPGQVAAAERILDGLGFERYLAGVDLDEHWPHAAVAWKRGDTELVDLHRQLWGTGATAEAAWESLRAHRDTLSLGPVDVAILDAPGTALHLALHAAQHGAASPRPLDDLTLALERLDGAVWTDAAALAGALDAVPAFSAGLRLVPAGVELADLLRLTERFPAHVALAASSAPLTAQTLERLAAGGGPAGRARFVLGRLVPPAGWMRVNYPLARRGRAGLLTAYAWRFAIVPVRLVRAVPSWRRARSTRAPAPTERPTP